jgi:NADPH:quinone reductase-like Zn-dependent oxidoreductase
MLAAYAATLEPDNPLAALVVGDRPEPVPPAPDWVTVRVRASSLNHHDLWSLRGVGLSPQRLPMTLGCDAAGVDPDGNEVVVYPVVADPGDPRGLSILSEHHQGTFAELVTVPRANLVPKPVGGRRVPADRLAHRVPDAGHPGTRGRGGGGAGPGLRRGSGHRGGGARRRAR